MCEKAVSGRTLPPLSSLALELNETYLWHGAPPAMIDVFTMGYPTEHAAREPRAVRQVSAAP